MRLTLSGVLSATLALPPTTRGWRQKWEQVQEAARRLVGPYAAPMNGSAIHERVQDLLAFYVLCYHLKDALKDEAPNGLSGQSVEAAINNSPALSLVADLCNLEKHAALDRRPRSGAIPSVGQARGRLRGETWTLDLPILHGPRTLDGIALASDAVAAWQRALAGFGL